MGLCTASRRDLEISLQANGLVGDTVDDRGASKELSDLVITVEAEDRHNFRERLGEISAPTLVIAGTMTRFTPVFLPRDRYRDSQFLAHSIP